jgi:hypothetical protein
MGLGESPFWGNRRAAICFRRGLGLYTGRVQLRGPARRQKGERDLTRLRDAGLALSGTTRMPPGLTMAAQLLFHRDPKRIVGVLRVTLLNRLNGSREWAELPLGR